MWDIVIVVVIVMVGLGLLFGLVLWAGSAAVDSINNAHD
jgi:hypothetical protein